MLDKKGEQAMLFPDLFGPPDVVKMEAKRDVQGLIKALVYQKDYGIRKAAAEALGKSSSVHAVEPLIGALKDKNHRVRQAAAWALRDIGDARAVKPLIAAYKNEHMYKDISDGMGIARPGFDMRHAVSEALVRIGAPAVDALIDALRNKNQDDDLSGLAGALSEIGPPAVQSCIAALKDEDNYVRKAAAWALRDVGDTRAVEPFIAALKDEEGAVRCTAAEALGKINDLRAVEPLIAALKDKDGDVRKVATKALSNFNNDARAIKALQDVQDRKASQESRSTDTRRTWSELLIQRVMAEAKLAFPQLRASVYMIGIEPPAGLKRNDFDGAEDFVVGLEAASPFEHIRFRFAVAFFGLASNKFEFIKHADLKAAEFSGFFWPPHHDWASTPLIYENGHLGRAITP